VQGTGASFYPLWSQGIIMTKSPHRTSPFLFIKLITHIHDGASVKLAIEMRNIEAGSIS
jgi:hypothetical protein